MALRVVRLGSPRKKGEGLRIGAARRPPRGVKKTDYARLNYYDVWLPELAPSQKWVSWALSQPWTDQRWRKYARNYRREMSEPRAARLLDLVAALSHGASISVGCYCENENRCHRSLLRELLRERGAKLARAARGKRTIVHLSKKTRTALSKQAAKVAKRRRKKS